VTTKPSLIEAVHALAQAVYADASQIDDTVSVEIQRAHAYEPEEPTRWHASVLAASSLNEPRPQIGATFEAASAEAALASLGTSLSARLGKQVVESKAALEMFARATEDDDG
jgi:hypothetical protein